MPPKYLDCEVFNGGVRGSSRRLEETEGLVLRFVVGHSADAQLEGLMNAEQEKHRDFLRLPITVRPVP